MRAKRLKAGAKALVEGWARRPGVLVAVPPGSDDDWYWMLASLSIQSRGCDFVVTNDAARDHHFMRLAPRPFMRWKHRHVLNFEFAKRDARRAPDHQGGGRGGDDEPDPNVAAAGATHRERAGTFGARTHATMATNVGTFVLAEPPTFSRELQKLVSATHDAWLLPVAETPGVWLALHRPR